MADRRAREATRAPRWDLPYTGFVSFLRSPTCTDLDRLDADVAVLGVPSDEGSPWKPGARFAPRKIRELSVQFAGRSWHGHDPETVQRAHARSRVRWRFMDSRRRCRLLLQLH